MEHFIRKPFAVEGDRGAVPVNLNPTGKVSFATGYSFDYERDSESDPQAKNIERREFNELMYIVTSAIRQYQTQGVPPYITPEDNGGNAFAYVKKARCLFDGGSGPDVYVSLADNNTSTPADAKKWRREDALEYVQGTRQITTVAPLKGGGPLSKDLSLSLDTSSIVGTGRKINTTAPLTGGGALTGDLTLKLNATAAPTANAVILRDTGGRAKVAAPAAADDIARKAEVDVMVKKAGDTMTGNFTLSSNGKLVFANSTAASKVQFYSGYEAGIQSGTLYFRTGGGIRFYKNGAHQEAAGAGTGGAEMLKLDNGAAVFNGSVQGTRFIGPADTATKLTTARTIALTGTVTGNVNFNGSGNVSIATKATAASLGFTQSLTANGWCKLPNGLILQWVRSMTGSSYWTFPIAFPKACMIAMPFDVSGTGRVHPKARGGINGVVGVNVCGVIKATESFGCIALGY